MIAELRKGSRANANVRGWFSSLDANDVALSVLTIGELRRGAESIRRRDDRAGRALERWLRMIVEEYRERILDVDAPVAEEWGRLGVPDPIPVVDGLLAATAIVHRLTFATRNVMDVARTGVPVVDPFAA